MQQKDKFLVSDSRKEYSQPTENLKADQSTSAAILLDSPPPERTLVGGHEMFLMDTDESTPAPLDSSMKLQTTSAPSNRKTLRPRKRQKTLHQADEPMVEELPGQMGGNDGTVVPIPNTTDSERKAFIKRFGVWRGERTHGTSP